MLEDGNLNDEQTQKLKRMLQELEGSGDGAPEAVAAMERLLEEAKRVQSQIAHLDNNLALDETREGTEPDTDSSDEIRRFSDRLNQIKEETDLEKIIAALSALADDIEKSLEDLKAAANQLADIVGGMVEKINTTIKEIEAELNDAKAHEEEQAGPQAGI